MPTNSNEVWRLSTHKTTMACMSHIHAWMRSAYRYPHTIHVVWRLLNRLVLYGNQQTHICSMRVCEMQKTYWNGCCLQFLRMNYIWQVKQKIEWYRWPDYLVIIIGALQRLHLNILSCSISYALSFLYINSAQKSFTLINLLVMKSSLVHFQTYFCQ